MKYVFGFFPCIVEIIYKNVHEICQVIIEDLLNHSLKNGRCIFQTKHHYYSHNYTPFSGECSSLPICQGNFDVVVAAKSIKKGVYFFSTTLSRRESVNGSGKGSGIVAAINF